MKKNTFITLLIASILLLTTSAAARDVEYKGGEVEVYIKPGEPTQIEFPGDIKTGYFRKPSALTIDRSKENIVVFANANLAEDGEAILVRLDDGRSFSVRVRKAETADERDAIIKVIDGRSNIFSEEEELPEYQEREFSYAPASQVTGFMRELVLLAEFGKGSIPGYRISDRYKGETILDDGAVVAKVDKIIMGPNLWGYVIDATNRTETSVRVNPATFRLDGTRAISMKNWELAPRPMTAENELAGKHTTKVYVITRAGESR